MAFVHLPARASPVAEAHDPDKVPCSAFEYDLDEGNAQPGLPGPSRHVGSPAKKKDRPPGPDSTIGEVAPRHAQHRPAKNDDE